MHSRCLGVARTEGSPHLVPSANARPDTEKMHRKQSGIGTPEDAPNIMALDGNRASGGPFGPRPRPPGLIYIHICIEGQRSELEGTNEEACAAQSTPDHGFGNVVAPEGSSQTRARLRVTDVCIHAWEIRRPPYCMQRHLTKTTAAQCPARGLRCSNLADKTDKAPRLLARLRRACVQALRGAP